jgi:hypothetical protein
LLRPNKGQTCVSALKIIAASIFEKFTKNPKNLQLDGCFYFNWQAAVGRGLRTAPL